MAGWFELEGMEFERLLEVLSSSGITYLKLRKGDVEFVVSRASGSNDPGPPARPATSVLADPADPVSAARPWQAAAGRQRDAEPAQPGPGTSPVLPVTAPMSGFFHHTPEPGAAPFVAAGTPVTEESTVGLIEAMKVFTAVQAGVAGVVAEVLVDAGEFVEEGQPLVSVRRDGAADEAAR